ncbi:MAG: DUF4079 domain-containing protein [Cyanophyceae cyanobacterium]
MDLPSFVWLWRWAAWSMGGVILLYGLLLITGLKIFQQHRAWFSSGSAVRWIHITLGILLVGLVLELLAIGVVGTLGHFGSLGQSVHLGAGVGVTGLTLLTAWHGWQGRQWQSSRGIHLVLNGVLAVALIGVSWTGWQVVQKYLP